MSDAVPQRRRSATLPPKFTIVQVKACGFTHRLPAFLAAASARPFSLSNPRLLMALPINIADLFTGQTVEWARLEFKEGWNPGAVQRTLCAFANDFHNWGGGYLVIGVAEVDGRPVLPPAGLDPAAIDSIQKELLNISHRLQPAYFPRVEVAQLMGKSIIVIWAPGGQNRPYKAPVSLAKDERQYAYYVRHGSSSVVARGPIELELLQLTANVPFDDRMHHTATLADLELRLIQAHLQEVRSALFAESRVLDFATLCDRMKIVDGPAEQLRPRNVGLLFFSDRPDRFFDTAWIDVVHLPQGPAYPEVREQRFTGPLGVQLRAALAYIQNAFIQARTLKRPDRAEADRFFTFPYEAVEEALANAVYHRGYDVRENIEVRVTPTEMTITSYPGPDPSLRLENLRTGGVVARRYRNRRIGEFLKELRLTEGRGTGVPTILRAMRDNGSPEPRFETDDVRSYFTTILPVHPAASEATPPIDAQDAAILDLTRRVGSIRKQDVADLLSLGDERTRYRLRRLVTRGLLVTRGARRGAYYVLPEGDTPIPSSDVPKSPPRGR